MSERGAGSVPVFLIDLRTVNKAGHHRPARKTPFKWRFTGGPMLARHQTLAGPILVFLREPTICNFPVWGG